MLPRAMSVNTFEAIAPGTQPTMIIPSRKSSEIGNEYATKHANRGIETYWTAVPISTVGQFLKRLLTSRLGSRHPIENIVKQIT